jgi:drug/metabolite transporter (DMT)-like permease
LTLVCFAANSLLCRAALGAHLLDAESFTGIRLLAGALVLALLARGHGIGGQGSWLSAIVLAVYAFAFSFAYLRIGAGIGALILFAAVQVTMIGWSFAHRDRARAAEICGVALALGGLAYLTLPGTRSVDLGGAALMALAGVAWGGYSLRGRSASHPIGTNADNFLRSLPLAAAVAAPPLLRGAAHITASGAALAAASGAVASGVGYSLWYAALRSLSATRAAIVQLAVPPLAAVLAVVLLGETLTPRFVAASIAILGGIAIAIVGRR